MPTFTLWPTKDLWIRTDYPTANQNGFGLTTGVSSGIGTSYPHRTLLHYDLTSMPAYAALTAAKIRMNCIGAGLLDVEARVHRLTQQAWTEAGATWNTYDGTNAWAAAGGDYAANPQVTWLQPSSGGFVDITGMLALVQDAIANRGAQLHVLLKQLNEAFVAGSYYYGDREAGAFFGETYVPRLIVDYTAAAEQLPVAEPKSTSGSAGAALPASPAGAALPASPARGA